MIAGILLLAGVAAMPDWKAVEAAAVTYWGQPTAENATLLWSRLPNYRPVGDQRPPYDQALDTFEVWESPWGYPGAVVAKLYALVWCIEPEVLEGRDAEVRLAFRLLHVADAAFAEDLGALLGRLATTRPETFLREVAALSSEFPEHRLVALAGDAGDLDEPEAIAELEARRQALTAVTAPRYGVLREACLAEVERSLHWYQREGSR